MEAKVISSGNSGHLVMLTEKGSHLFLGGGADGVSISKFFKRFDVKLSDVVGVLIPNKRVENFESVRSFEIKTPIYMPSEAREWSITRTFSRYNMLAIAEKKWVKVGPFKIYAFPIESEKIVSFAYIIKTKKNKILYFANGTGYVANKELSKIDNYFIETNYTFETKEKSHKGYLGLTKNIVKNTSYKKTTNVFLLDVARTVADKNAILKFADSQKDSIKWHVVDFNDVFEI